MLRILFSSLIILLFQSTLLGQLNAGYQIQEFTTENGMPSNGIKGLQWDERTGFLWIATEAGVVRFNGIDCKSFTRDNTPFFSEERMSSITKSGKDSIFITDLAGNIFSVKSNLLSPYKGRQINWQADGRNRFMLAAQESSFFNKIADFRQKRKNEVWLKMLLGGDSLCLILNNRRELYYTTKNKREFSLFTNIGIEFENGFMNNAGCFLVDKDFQYYKVSTTPNDSLQFSKVGYTGSYVFETADKPSLFWSSGINEPVLISGSNALLLLYENNSITTKLICTNIPTNAFIRDVVYSEKIKTLFLGTDSKGLIVIKKNTVFPVKKSNAGINERNAFYSQVELKDGSILTNEGKIISTNEKADASLPIEGKFNNSVYADGDSLLWYSQFAAGYSANCLHQYNYTTGKTTIYNKIVITKNLFGIVRSGKKIYVSTSYGIGILEKDSLRLLTRYDPNDPRDMAPFLMQEIHPGVLGIASCAGYWQYDIAAKKMDTVIAPKGFCVRNFWKYNDHIFIGTYGKGFYIYKNGKLKAMPLDKNNFLLYTHCFVPDNKGYCWISTNRGLFKVQLQDMIDAFEKDIPQVYYHYFGKNDGMAITEMNGGCAPCALTLTNKTISFPTMDGLLWVQPANNIPLLPEGNIFIDAFIADNKIINSGALASKSLPATTKEITIQLGFSAWCNKENIYLQYRLHENDPWQPVVFNNEAIINLSNLRQGTHRLQIRKLNGFGTNNYSYSELKFSIKTPWNETWWFYTLCILALSALIILFIRIRTKQYKLRQKKLEQQVSEKTNELLIKNEVLEKNNSINARLISIISHDIITPLKFLTVAGKSLQEKRNQMPEELQQETISEITNTSQELQLLSTNILNWIKYQNENRRLVKENFNLHELVQQVLGILQSLAKQKRLTIENLVDEEMKVYQFYEPLKILIYNLLTNSIRFTEKGVIEVSAVENKGQVVVSVKDQGTGMSPEKIKSLMEDQVVITSANVDNKKGHGLGYLIIKDLLKTMGASLHIESKIGEGSTVSIRFAIKNNGTEIKVK